jgi:hypothetical protein
VIGEVNSEEGGSTYLKTLSKHLTRWLLELLIMP